jgi:hypothetical protein
MREMRASGLPLSYLRSGREAGVLTQEQAELTSGTG